MEQDTDSLILQCIKINYKSRCRISEELGIPKATVVKGLARLKKRGYLTWILYSAREGERGPIGMKYLWMEKKCI